MMTVRNYGWRVPGVTRREVLDGLLLACAALVVLPLMPNQAVGPYGAVNPFKVWRLVVLVMALSAAGYVALRIFGPRFGLPISGFVSGFVSSSATIGAMGSRSRKNAVVHRPAVAAAVLSTVATVVQMFIVVGATEAQAMRELTPAMTAAGIAAAGYGIVFAARAWQHQGAGEVVHGRAFEPREALIFAATVGIILFVSAVLNEWIGESGVVVSAALAGFADTHAAAISVASLAATGHIEPGEAVVPILTAFTTNSITKAVVSYASGGRRFALEVWPGLGLVLAAAWAGWGLGYWV